MSDRAETRGRLLETRKRLLDDLDKHLDAGVLALLAGVQSALAAIDAEAAEAEPMVRAVVSHAPGLPITLALYGEDGSAVATELDPIRALNVAAELIADALARLR